MSLADFGSMDPLFIDLETQSSEDLKKVGGWVYASHHNTRLLTVSWTDRKREKEHIWFVGRDKEEAEIRHHCDIITPESTIHVGTPIPPELLAERHRVWYAHNAWTFDQLVWERLVGEACEPAGWGDTYPLALASGLPGGLNSIGKRLWGEGKYEEGNNVAKKVTRSVAIPRTAELAQVGKYNVQDVRLLAWLWDEIVNTLEMPEWEYELLHVHNEINSRGSRVDVELLQALINFSRVCRITSLEEVRKLTGGQLATEKDLRSRTKIFAWLKSKGVYLGESLAKDIVKRFIEKNTVDDDDEPKDDWGQEDAEIPADIAPVEEEDESEEEEVPSNLPLVLKVLQLRMSALRITDGKLDAAMQALDDYDRIRGLFAYWAAHTGRWGGRRVQVQNLPTPKKGVDVWGFLKTFEDTGRLDYDTIRKMMPIGQGPEFRFLTVDDAASAMIAMIFLPDEDEIMVSADLSGIEARVLAWLAGEKWLLEAFWRGEDPYLKQAEGVYGPRDSWVKIPDPENPGFYLSPKKHPYRQVGKVIELGCGYQMGKRGMAVFAAAMGIDLKEAGTTPEDAVVAYRKLHPAIAGTYEGRLGKTVKRHVFKGGFWYNLNEAAIAAVQNPGLPIRVGLIEFEKKKGHLYVTLPSGRKLVYRNARIRMIKPPYLEEDDKSKYVPAVVYVHPRYGEIYGYGGKWAENVVQATASDFLREILLRLAREKSQRYKTILHVHDSGVASTKKTDQAVPRFMELFTTLPEWAPGFPLQAEGGPLPRYSKGPPKGKEWEEVTYINGRPK